MDPNLKREKARKWEDLETDCLANVFQHVGVVSLIFVIPFVCKSWYRASLNPLCWKRLIFPDAERGTEFDPLSIETVDESPFTRRPRIQDLSDPEAEQFMSFLRRCAREYGIDWKHFSISGFIKSLINRSKGNLEFLKLPGISIDYPSAINKILKHIHNNCRNFRGFHFCRADLSNCEEVLDIVKYLPNIKCLYLSGGLILRDDVLELLKGCKSLEVLDLRNCVGFWVGDQEISQLASNIPRFTCAGSYHNTRYENLTIAFRQKGIKRRSNRLGNDRALA